MISGGCTDIRAAMRAFEKAVRTEKGNKQVYLITDSEPNTEEGIHVGFERAVHGVMEEASHYRKLDIGLNVLMLDDAPHLRRVASALARRNMGRVFFSTPGIEKSGRRKI